MSINLKIVAFDGQVIAPISRALPVIYNSSNNRYFILNDDSTLVKPSITWCDREFAEMKAEGRIIALEHPVNAFPNATVAYLRNDALSALKGLPKRINGESLFWQQISQPHSAWATCLKAAAVLQLLDEQAAVLLLKADTALGEFFKEQDLSQCKEAFTYSKIAISAARTPSLRSRIYIRYGLALRYTKPPESLSNVHLLIEKEFPSLTWKTFLDEIQHLQDVLSANAKQPKRVLVASAGKSTFDIFFEKVDRIRKVSNIMERLALAQQYANACTVGATDRARFLSGLREQLKNRDSINPRIPLHSSSFELLCTLPICYFPGVIMPLSKRTALDLRELEYVYEQLDQQQIRFDTLNDIESLLLEADSCLLA